MLDKPPPPRARYTAMGIDWYVGDPTPLVVTLHRVLRAIIILLIGLGVPALIIGYHLL